MKQRLIMFSISLFCLVSIVGIRRSIYTLWKQGGVIAEHEAVLVKLQEENQQLQKKLADVRSVEYIEHAAREKLNLQKAGEVVVVLPKSQVWDPNEENIPEPRLSNWQQWWKLFF